MLRVGELRLETRQINHRVAIARLRICRPAIDLHVVLAEIRLDVVRGVDAREVDPGLIARARVISGTFDENVDLWNGEDITAGLDVSLDQRESEWPDRSDNEIRFRAAWEVNDEGVGVSSEFDFEIGGGGG